MSAAASLEIINIQVGYGTLEVLHGVSLSVQPGEIVSLIGANGAGKSTLLNAISGVVPVKGGQVFLDGQDIRSLNAPKIARAGLRQVPEGRRIFADLSVEDNLLLGGYGVTTAHQRHDRLEEIFDLFPRLKERRWQPGGTLSGGEQQMLAIGRALVASPRLLMLDEPSMGLAPLVTRDVFALIGRLRKELGIGILLVEQNARAALKMSDRAYVLTLGEIQQHGASADLLRDPRVLSAFLGESSAPNGEMPGISRPEW